MPRLIALYDHPEDPAAFDEHYRSVHAPIVDRYPNLRGVRLTTPRGVAGRPAPYHLMAEMSFDTMADLEAALSSDAGIESAKDLRNFASAGVRLFIAPDEADA
ncbi:MAG TPA: EthD family reductase [Candidatus Limnocylindria bacterium]|nr:EthD family reductase [Candidatus Limnocylindria bacterium]